MRTVPRGGHFPGHIRDTFLEAIEEFAEWEPGTPEPSVTLEIRYEPHQIPLSKACGLLWNCADVLPGWAFDQLVGCGLDVRRQTYAAAARAMRENIVPE